MGTNRSNLWCCFLLGAAGILGNPNFAQAERVTCRTSAAKPDYYRLEINRARGTSDISMRAKGGYKKVFANATTAVNAGADRAFLVEAIPSKAIGKTSVGSCGYIAITLNFDVPNGQAKRKGTLNTMLEYRRPPNSTKCAKGHPPYDSIDATEEITCT